MGRRGRRSSPSSATSSTTPGAHVVVGGPMTRSAGFLIEATGADITLAELSVLLNDGFEDRIGRGVPLMPGAARLLAELAAHDDPHRAGLRLAPRASSTASWPRSAREHFAPDPRRRRGGAHQAAPRPVSDSPPRGLGADPASARSSRTPRPVSPPPRPRAATSSPCPRWRRSRPAARRTVVTSLEEVDLPFLRTARSRKAAEPFTERASGKCAENRSGADLLILASRMRWLNSVPRHGALNV